MSRARCQEVLADIKDSLKEIETLVTNYRFMQAREELLMTTLDSVKDLNDSLIEALTEADMTRRVRP